MQSETDATVIYFYGFSVIQHQYASSLVPHTKKAWVKFEKIRCHEKIQ